MTARSAFGRVTPTTSIQDAKGCSDFAYLQIPCSGQLGDREHLVGIVFPTGGRWQGLPFLLIQGQHLLHHLANLRKHFFLVVAVAATVEQSWTTAHKTLIFFRPFHYLDVTSAFFHRFDSSIAARTAFSWYCFASS